KKCANNEYEFFLVDLNRMNFHTTMSFEQRMDNFRRLTPKKEMVALMSNEYAKLYPAKTETEIFEKMWQATEQFQYEFAKKKRLKKKLKFWKS
ncbi:Kdo domain containing protein, partial [Flavobacterium branchiarum]|nr:Kdo domain containing protein [Flavobacterium branchiarum]